MNISEVLKIQSLNEAKLIAGKQGILNKVNGINILEAIDIENWGRHGDIILSSYFALQNLSDSEMDDFFQKLHDINISAIIIKIDRLVCSIPDKIIELCNKYSIPLIQIGRDVKYESIILEILGPIINRNVSLLNKYYEIHSELTSLALKMPSMEDILSEFKKMLQRDVSIINTVNGTQICTNPELRNVTVLETNEVLPEKYMHFKYLRKAVIYNDTDTKKTGNQLSVRIPNLGYDTYELVIHELANQISLEDFMVIENGVKFLQMELLKKYVISQNLFQQKNNIISDLLNDRLYEEKDIDDVLETLKICKHKYYQVVLVKLYQHDENKVLHGNPIAQALMQIRMKFKASFRDIVFLEKLDRIAFIINFGLDKDDITEESIEKIMNPLVEDNTFKDFFYYVSISSKVVKTGISKANREVLDIQKVLRLFHNSNKILTYEDMGIYKLFLDSNSLGCLEKFISPKIKNFRDKYPQLFETLKTFLDTNQSYNHTAEKLFLHTKTVRYRIDKVKELIGIDFTNPEEILQIQVASRLFKLIDGRKVNE